MLTIEKITAALSQVQEPDLGQDLVTLNMVKDIVIDGQKVSFTVVLTTPACPLKEEIKKACVNAIQILVDKSAEVEVNFTSKVNTQRLATDLTLPGVKNIIAVSSGKGGVGKSSMAVNLAVALGASGAVVGLLDADIYGPSVPTMMGVKDTRPMMQNVDGKNKIVPIESHGIKSLSIGNLIDEKQAVIWRGPMASTAIKQFITDVHWGELDYLILDLPPGTGDIHLTILQSLPVTGAIIVTTPQKLASADVKKGIMMFDLPQLRIPILGIVENMAYFTPPDYPDKKYFIFGQGEGRVMADQFELEFLGEIPILIEIREGADKGQPVALLAGNPAKEIYKNFASKIAQRIAILNNSKK